MAVPAMGNNSPSAGYISWDLFHIQYEGVGYEVPAGSTADKWVWWRFNAGVPVVETGASVPADLTGDDLLLFGNSNGIALRIQSSNLISGEMIVDGSIFADAIAANQINSGHVVTAGLDAGVIKFGTMSGDRIGVNTLAGDRIVANSIVASKLGISDLTNYLLGGGFERSQELGNFTNGAWTRFSVDTTPANVAGSLGALKVDASTGVATLVQSLPVRAGQKFFISYDVKTTADYNGTSSNGKLRLGDQNGTILAAYTWPVSSAGYTSYAQTYTVPSGVTALQVSLSFDHTVGTIWVDNVEFRQMNAGKLIVDGSINSNHVVTAGLDAGVIKFGTMSGDRITANTINSGHVVTAGLDAATVKFGTMHGDRITAGTLNANRIIASTMTADLLTANNALVDALTVTDLSASTLNSVNIQGGTIAIATSTATTDNESFTGTALPTGWSHVQHTATASVPVSVGVNTAPGTGSDNGVALRILSTTTDFTTTGLDVTQGYVSVDTGTAVDVEVNSRYRITSASSSGERYRLFIRQSGSFESSTETGIYLALDEAINPGLYYVVAGGTPELIGTLPITLVANTWYNVRIRAVAGQVSAAVWTAGTTQPKMSVFQVSSVLTPGKVAIEYYVSRFMNPPNGKDVYIDYVNIQNMVTGFTVNPDGVADVTSLTVDNLNGRAIKKFDFGINPVQATSSTGYILVNHNMGIKAKFATAIPTNLLGQALNVTWDETNSTTSANRFKIMDDAGVALNGGSIELAYFCIA